MFIADCRDNGERNYRLSSSHAKGVEFKTEILEYVKHDVQEHE